jgi:outer membrane protein assembly factor BamA
MWCCGALLTVLLSAPPPQDQSVPVSGGADLYDVTDLIRKIRGRTITPEEQAAAHDARRPAYAIAPVIGYKPASGALAGIAGNVAVLRGDPATTQMSSMVMSATFSTKKQTSLTARFNVVGADNRWELDGDNRAQWTSQDTFGLGTTTSPDARVNMRFDRFRFYETVAAKVYRGLLAGAGFYYSTNTNVEPREGSEEAWSSSPYVTYTVANGLPLEGQTSAGPGFSLEVDTRDSAINARRGWLASASYRTFVKGFLGGDSTWQELYLDGRTYRPLGTIRRQTLAFWFWADLVTGGVAPYLDLPATGMDKYGRSGRGYAEGRFRGERLIYGEVEYRATLTRNGFMGMVAFLNTTSLANRASGEQLFDNFATGAGAGFRLLLNKRSKTNLCVDFGWGRAGSRGFYLSVQEAF